MMDKNYSQSNNTISVQNIQDKKVLSKALLSDRTHRYDNHHLQIYQQYTTSLLNQWTSDLFRHSSYIGLSLLITRTMQAEYSYRSVFDHGDLHSEDSLFYKIYEKEFDTFTNYLDRYIEQSSENAPDADTNWSLYFLTDYITTEALYHQGKKIMADPKSIEEWLPDTEGMSHTDLLKEFDKVFYGLYPILSKDNAEIRSHIPMKYSSQFCYGFLLVPERIIKKFSDNIPAYLHEIFHYIPPVSRTSRNQVALELIAYSILSEWTNALSKKMTENAFSADKIRRVCDYYVMNLLGELIGYIVYLEKKKYPSVIKRDMISMDSMNLAILQSEFIYSTSDQEFIDILLSTNLSKLPFSSEEHAVLKIIVDDLARDSKLIGTLKNIWKYEADSYATTYNSLLRELRSDLNMVILLDMDLKTYIRTMIKELDFSTDNDKIVADSVILRFGFMTRFLAQYDSVSKPDFSPCTSAEEITNWRESCKQIFNQIQIEENFDSQENQHHLTHLLNIMSYIDIYRDMVIEQNEGYYIAPYHSLLEILLTPQINKWKNNAIEMYDYGSIRFLRKIASKEIHADTEKELFQYIDETSRQSIAAWNLSWPYPPSN